MGMVHKDERFMADLTVNRRLTMHLRFVKFVYWGLLPTGDWIFCPAPCVQAIVKLLYRSTRQSGIALKNSQL